MMVCTDCALLADPTENVSKGREPGSVVSSSFIPNISLTDRCTRSQFERDRYLVDRSQRRSPRHHPTSTHGRVYKRIQTG